MKTKLLALTFFWPLLFPLVCYGDELALKTSYLATSPDRRYVFVMLGAESSSKALTAEDRARENSIRAKYKYSGLYLNDGSDSPLWTVDWYAHSVFLFSDGSHLIREGPWATNSSDEALTFFSSGKEIRSYKIKDLVDLTWLLPHSVSHFRWLKSADVNDSDRTLTVATFLRDRYVFDVTGRIVSSRRPIRVVSAVLALIVVIIVLLLLVKIGRRPRQAA